MYYMYLSFTYLKTKINNSLSIFKIRIDIYRNQISAISHSVLKNRKKDIKS